ncbi:branched-chain amino acid transport system ATP-binding protein [Variovorax boronicumulans]|nr:branched-chain amino acid transport system ATP-binding protein [Variovorax boronicumulans]MDQ0005115.1 branched-chain amino acid transport system ATP-binding protein [Variovorax boronicumulans]
MTLPIIETRNVRRMYGAFVATDNVDFSLKAGERRALIGPNGAGKTTFLNLLTGQVAPTSGSVWLAGEDVSKVPMHRRVRRGVARTFQLNTLLRESSVLENVQLAVLEQQGLGGRLFGGKAAQREAANTAMDILQKLGMSSHAAKRIADLPYGRQRLVEIAIALALRPKVLLLDEPAAGVPPADSHLVMDTIADLPGDIAVLIIEHDMKLVFRFAQRINVLVRGRMLTEGTPAEIAADPRVREVYLGRAHHA